MGFLIIFLIAFLGRGLSAYLLTKQYEPAIKYHEGYYFSFWSFIKKMRFNNYGHFVIFNTIVLFGTAIASPFFSVYMLKNLQLSYISYTLVLISPIVATIFFMPWWGRFADRFGNIKTMKIASWLVPFVPILWLLSTVIPPILLVPYLLVIEFYSGMAWAGFNLSTGNFIYDAVTRERVGVCFAYENVISATGTVVGATIGGVIVSYKFDILGLNAILFIFAISAIIRLLVPLTMLSLVKEVKTVEPFKMSTFNHDLKESITKIRPQKALRGFMKILNPIKEATED